LSLSLPGFTPVKGQAAFGWPSGIVDSLRHEICCSLYSQACKLPTPLIHGRNRDGFHLAFSGVPKYVYYRVMHE